jgi:ubiquitin C-terminal hydrolase
VRTRSKENVVPPKKKETRVTVDPFNEESQSPMDQAAGQVVVGLTNLKNSCYLNSIVQCLSRIKALADFFLSDNYFSDMDPLRSKENEVAKAFASLLKQMQSGKHGTLKPELLKRACTNYGSQFNNSYQQDSHEFCEYLMDALHEGLNRVKSKPYIEAPEGVGTDPIESWRMHLHLNNSIIVDRCQGLLRSGITCLECQSESIKFDVFSSISLPVDTTKNLPTLGLYDCIEKFMEEERLVGDNAWDCQKCSKKVRATKRIALWSVPDILVFHMKRFTFDITSGTMPRAKIDCKVEFPIEGLDLTEIIVGPRDSNAPPVYKLVGVSEHLGATVNEGHYAARVRNSIDDQWYCCNDENVHPISGKNAVTKDAYVLFYQRAKGLSKWSGMGQAMEKQGSTTTHAAD